MLKPLLLNQVYQPSTLQFCTYSSALMISHVCTQALLMILLIRPICIMCKPSPSSTLKKEGRERVMED